MSSSLLQKEMKRLAKAQHMAGITPTVTVVAAAVPAPANTPGASGHPPVARSNTPRPGSNSVTSRPGVPTPSQNNNPQARGSTPVGIGTPRSVSTPGGTATATNANANSAGVSGSTSAPAQLGTQAVAPMMPASATSSGNTVNGSDVKRGIKREREDSVNGTGVRPINGNSQPAEVKPYAGAKPGMNGIRPRPVKKQRVVSGLVMCGIAPQRNSRLASIGWRSRAYSAAHPTRVDVEDECSARQDSLHSDAVATVLYVCIIESCVDHDVVGG